MAVIDFLAAKESRAQSLYAVQDAGKTVASGMATQEEALEVLAGMRTQEPKKAYALVEVTRKVAPARIEGDRA